MKTKEVGVGEVAFIALTEDRRIIGSGIVRVIVKEDALYAVAPSAMRVERSGTIIAIAVYWGAADVRAEVPMVKQSVVAGGRVTFNWRGPVLRLKG